MMQEANETKGRKKGLFALLRESIAKSNEGCGPGCGCHAANEKKKAKGSEIAGDGKKV